MDDESAKRGTTPHDRESDSFECTSTSRVARGRVGWGSTEFIVLRTRDGVPEEFAYLLARSRDFRAHAIANMTGSSGRQRVPKSCLEQYPVVRPTADVLRAFRDQVRPFFQLIAGNTLESRALAAMRDLLLPRVVSGEIRFRDAESAVERAV